MNFLFLNSSKAWGGNEKWTYMATHALAKETNVYLAYQNETLGNRFHLQKFKLPFLGEFDLYTIFRLIFIVKKNNIDILIPTKRKDYMIAGIVSRLCGKKNILRLGIVRHLKGWHQNLVYNKLADGIIVNAKVIKDHLLKSKFMKEEKIAVIYNGLDIEELDRIALNNSSQNKPFPFLISAMGTLSRRKRFDLLLKAFAQFLRTSQAKDAGLIIIGDGNQKESLKTLANTLKINNKVIFTGFLINPYYYLKLSDIFVSTSQNEGISNSLLEAGYLKNAIITTATGGIEEIIINGENGYLIENNNIDQLSQLLLQLYNNPLLKTKLAENFHKTVAEKFSIEKMKKEIIQFCSEKLYNLPSVSNGGIKKNEL